MSFIVVNTGRAASRAFYLTMRAQPHLHVPSRYLLDRAVSEFVEAGSTATLDQISRQAAKHDQVGLVFHGVRPRLAYPFDSATNHDLLSRIRDSVGITTAVLVVRDPAEVLVSELNRRMAGLVGDWSFPRSDSGWRTQLGPSQMRRLNPQVTVDPDVVAPLGNVDIAGLVNELSERTGKADSLARLFGGVFENTIVLPYRTFVDDPHAVFDQLESELDCAFSDRSLVDVKLNGLANRLLVYNPFAIRHDGQWLRLRFEVAGAVELCRDWASLEGLSVDTSDWMPAVARSVGSPVGLGVHVEDMHALGSGADVVRSTAFQADLLDAVAPTFASMFEATEAMYRSHVYRTEWPADAHRAFEAINGSEIEATHRLLQSATPVQLS